jgi:hypothetical protein
MKDQKVGHSLETQKKDIETSTQKTDENEKSPFRTKFNILVRSWRGSQLIPPPPPPPWPPSPAPVSNQWKTNQHLVVVQLVNH